MGLGTPTFNWSLWFGLSVYMHRFLQKNGLDPNHRTKPDWLSYRFAHAHNLVESKGSREDRTETNLRVAGLRDGLRRGMEQHRANAFTKARWVYVKLGDLIPPDPDHAHDARSVVGHEAMVRVKLIPDGLFGSMLPAVVSDLSYAETFLSRAELERGALQTAHLSAIGVAHFSDQEAFHFFSLDEWANSVVPQPWRNPAGRRGASCHRDLSLRLEGMQKGL